MLEVHFCSEQHVFMRAIVHIPGLTIYHIVLQRFSCKRIFKNMLHSRGVFHIMGCARINAFVAKPICVLQLLAI